MIGRTFMVTLGMTTRLDRQTNIASGSAEWLARRTGKTIGSSQAAAVFNGVSSTSTKDDFLKSLKGIARPPANAYLQRMLDAGRDMEPVLRNEAHYVLELLLARRLISYVPCQFVGDTHYGIEERSTPDLIVIDTDLQHAALVEIKWRTSDGDCGWEHPLDRKSARRFLGLTVWCQAQHQMHVTGIHSAFVYSGSVRNRRLWHVAYCRTFREEHFLPALARCAEKDGADDHPKARHIAALTLLMEKSSHEIGLPVTYS
jgi:hypothetical protein